MPALPNANRANTFLPPRYWPAHNLCFFLHDVMVSLLGAGERAGAFSVRLQLSPDELKAVEVAENPLDFLTASHRSAERAAVLIAVMFPAILSDMLHCIYEALEASRKAKLNVAFVLLRKPIQESLYVLESVIADRDAFAQKLTDDPIKLWSQGAGGRAAHAKNVGRVLKAIGEDGRFDADYIAQLRYDKNAEDGFDGICNKAIHLFTSHPAISTGPLDINFIFSDCKSRESQWSFIYSRLPYLLSYTYQIVESVCAGIAPTSPGYLDDIQRRLAAHTILWGRTIEERYREPRLEACVAACERWLEKHCRDVGPPFVTTADLERMKETGALPGETRSSVWFRRQTFQAAAESSGSTPRTRLTAVLRRLGLIDTP